MSEKNLSLVARRSVFWPSYLAFFIIGGLAMVGGKPFVSLLERIKDFTFLKLDWLFASSTFAMVIICFLIYISPFAKVTIGPKGAPPLFTKMQWFSISLCTTVAAGIMFWATSEPLYHLYQPPKSLGITPGSKEALKFSMGTLFHHWSITPYAIYTLPALAFALAYYNRKEPFSLSALFAPLFGGNTKNYASLIDGICVFALVAGMASSLGTGALTLSGAFVDYFPKSAQPLIVLGIISLLVLCFTASAASGLMRGIRFLANLNVKAFLFIVLLLFFMGPTKYIINTALDGAYYFATYFYDMSLFTTSATKDPWPNSWPIFYWSNWLSWAPITAVFLGRISYGHTVRDFININFFAPALFSCIWMAIFGGSALYYDSIDGSLYNTLITLGPNAVSYELLNRLPISLFLIIIFMMVTFLSYTTSADSTTDAISSLCTKHEGSSLNAEGATWIKVAWAITIGFVSFILISHSGIEGMKLLSCLGGVPALFLVIVATFSLIKMALTHKSEQKAPLDTLTVDKVL